MYDYIIIKPELNEETLMHYGVLGMKWGKRKDKSVSFRKQKRIDKKNKIKQYKKDIRKAYNVYNKDYNYYNYGKNIGGFKSAAKLKYDIKDKKMNPVAAYAKRMGIDMTKTMAMSVAAIAAMGAWYTFGPGAGQYAKGNRMFAMGMARKGIDKVLDNVKKKKARKSVLKLVQKADIIIDGPFRVLS